MANFPTVANGIILEERGPYYHVKFNWVPRVGEFIDLTSLLEMRQNRTDESRRFYKVVAVVHDIYDVDEGGEKPYLGHHNLKIVVEKCDSKYFE